MRIQNNIMAMNTHRMYTSNNNSVSKSAEKLSSGYRINRAGDDAAGLAISEKMRAQVRGLNMASKNSQDAISLVQTAEGALQEVHSMLQRMNELSVQSATGTNADFDRTQIAAEFEQLKGEIDQIAETTNFNNKVLLDGSLATVGKASFSADLGKAIETVPAAAKSVTFAVDLSKFKKGDVFTVNYNAAGAKDMMVNGNFASLDALATSIQTQIGTAGVTATAADGKITITDGTGDDKNIAVVYTPEGTNKSAATLDFSNYNLTEGAGFAITVGGVTKNFIAQTTATAPTGTDVVAVDLQSAKTANVVAVAFAAKVNATFAAGQADAIATGSVVNINGSKVTSDSVNMVKTIGGLEIQVGAEEGNTLNVSVDAMNSEALGLKSITIDTQAKAGDAITATRHAVDVVSDMRARLGAMQNRLDHKISNLDNTAENLQAAESRIRDVDIAKEMTSYTKNNILSQASTAMLAQANAAPQNVLSLLQ